MVHSDPRGRCGPLTPQRSHGPLISTRKPRSNQLHTEIGPLNSTRKSRSTHLHKEAMVHSPHKEVTVHSLPQGSHSPIRSTRKSVHLAPQGNRGPFSFTRKSRSTDPHKEVTVHSPPQRSRCPLTSTKKSRSTHLHKEVAVSVLQHEVRSVHVTRVDAHRPLDVPLLQHVLPL